MVIRFFVALAIISVPAGAAAVTQLPSWTSLPSATLAGSVQGDKHNHKGAGPTPTASATPSPTPSPSSSPSPSSTPSPSPSSTPTAPPTPSPSPTGCTGVVLSPSSDLQEAIDSAPSATTFCLQPG